MLWRRTHKRQGGGVPLSTVVTLTIKAKPKVKEEEDTTADGNNMTLQDRHDKKLVILTFKCLNNLEPSYLQEKCILTSAVYEKNTRSCKYSKIKAERKRGYWRFLTFKARAAQI